MAMKKDFGSAASYLAAVVLLSGCASTGADDAKARPTAVAVLSPAANGPVKGQVTFQAEAQGVRVTASLTGLTPGKHGFHIHEKGDCSAADFTSAGGHWNPMSAEHGAPASGADHHYGDFGNVEANEKGIVKFDRVFQWLSFTGTNSFVGRAVVVHGNPDDLTSQPAGNAGPRIACGVIALAGAK